MTFKETKPENFQKYKINIARKKLESEGKNMISSHFKTGQKVAFEGSERATLQTVSFPAKFFRDGHKN